MITGDIKYSNPETRQNLFELHEQFENQSYVAGSLYTESWIRGWYEFLDNNAKFLKINATNEIDFIYNLRDVSIE